MQIDEKIEFIDKERRTEEREIFKMRISYELQKWKDLKK